MLGKKKEKPETENSQATDSAAPFPGQDLIVHNMPSPARLSGSFSDSTGSAKKISGDYNPEPASGKQNFKTIGLIIIGAGVIVIGVLVYLSYHFIISPAVTEEKTVVKNPAATEAAKIPAGNVEPAANTTATVTPAAVVTPAPVTIATSTATSSLAVGESISPSQESLPPLLDSDNDGLLDNEEILLGTSATSTDSDGDRYFDLVEINKGYDPAGAGKISANSGLTLYNNETFGYEILYPKDWVKQSLDNEATVIFMAPEDSLIQISVQDNPDHAGILGWYESAFSDAAATYDQLLSSDGWDGVMGEDNLNFYLTDSGHKNIYVISYIPAITDHLVYPNIFKLIINSLVIK